MTSAKVAVASWANVVKGAATPSEPTPIDAPLAASSSGALEESSSDQSHLPEVVSQETVETEIACETMDSMMRPGMRGSQESFCRGEVLSMLSHYGWLKPFTPIDHHSFWKHGGRIYVHRNDIINGEVLAPGDVVTFHLYADSRGLGAENCRVEQRAGGVERHPDFETSAVCASAVAPGVVSSGLRAEAAEFVPRSEVEPSQSEHPVASVFLRMSRTLESVYVNQYGQVAGINSAYFDDDDSSDDDVEAGDADRESCGEDSDHSSLDGCIVAAGDLATTFQEELSPSSRMKLLRNAAPWRKHKVAYDSNVRVAYDPTRAPWRKYKVAADSTTASGTSASESYDPTRAPWRKHKVAADSTTASGTSASESEGTSFVTKKVSELLTFRPPPGLSLPTEHDAPPGLFLPPGLA